MTPVLLHRSLTRLRRTLLHGNTPTRIGVSLRLVLPSIVV